MRLSIAALMIAGCIGFVGCSGGTASGPAVKSENVGTRPGAGAEKTTVGEDGTETTNAGSTTSSATPQ